MDIKDFLLARIAEDEAAAEACIGVNQRAAMKNGERPRRWVIDGRIIRDEDTAHEPAIPRVGHVWAREAEHIARHDPTRILAECAAKRAIIALADDVDTIDDALMIETMSWKWETSAKILGALATIYTDHPDYQQEWALEGAK